MGREVRRVPTSWEHPLDERNQLQPMFDKTFEQVAKEWKEAFLKWESGERPSYFDKECEEKNLQYWEWECGPPDRKYYRPWKDEEATWYQVWETVSEGTPVTPAFATKEELVDYLVAHGDFWDQQRCRDGSLLRVWNRTSPCWTRKNAEAFVGLGFAPTLIMANKRSYDASELGEIDEKREVL